MSIDDLAFLRHYVGDATVVGLGEATHGSREFFQLKHRVFQYLVEDLGFRTFAIEAKFEPSLAIDEYVKTGRGDPEELVNGLGFWTWDTEEVVALVRWIHAYNSRGGDQINFYGIDVQSGEGSLRRAVAFAAAHEPNATEGIRVRFEPLLSLGDLEDDAKEAARDRINSPASIHHLWQAAIELSLFLDRNGAALVSKSGERDYQLAKGAARAAVWWLAMQLQPDEWGYIRSRSVTDIRDRGMTDLVHWIHDIEGSDERIALWAHNGHIGKVPYRNNDRVVGTLLHDELGEDYYALGFAFEKGSFQAFRPASDEQAAEFMEHTVASADEDSLDGLLADVDADQFFVDLGEARVDSSADQWLSEPRRMRWTGALYSDELEAKHPPVRILDMFDGLIFVRETTRAWPAARTRERFELTDTWSDKQ